MPMCMLAKLSTDTRPLNLCLLYGFRSDETAACNFTQAQRFIIALVNQHLGQTPCFYASTAVIYSTNQSDSTFLSVSTWQKARC